MTPSQFDKLLAEQHPAVEQRAQQLFTHTENALKSGMLQVHIARRVSESIFGHNADDPFRRSVLDRFRQLCFDDGWLASTDITNQLDGVSIVTLERRLDFYGRNW